MVRGVGPRLWKRDKVAGRTCRAVWVKAQLLGRAWHSVTLQYPSASLSPPHLPDLAFKLV